MLKAEQPPTSPGQLERLTADEREVLRAFWRVGPGATTGEVVREVNRRLFLDYRFVLTLLRSIAEKGYLAVEREGPRREVWTPLVSEEVAAAEEMRHAVREAVGADLSAISSARDVLDELEAEAAASA